MKNVILIQWRPTIAIRVTHIDLISPNGMGNLSVLMGGGTGEVWDHFKS